MELLHVLEENVHLKMQASEGDIMTPGSHTSVADICQVLRGLGSGAGYVVPELHFYLCTHPIQHSPVTLAPRHGTQETQSGT